MMTISTQPYLCVGDVYDHMKTKTQNEVRYTTYFSILWNTLLDMFSYENLPDTIPKRFLESILHSTGEVFISEINGELIASHGTLSGQVDAYGLGTDCIAVCPTGQAEGKRGVDIAYGINNDTGSPDMLTYWIAHLLGETDKSIKTNVIFARMAKIPKVADEKDKAMFEELLKKVMDGEPQAFASKNALDLEFGAGTETFELTDVNKIDRLPYLTQFFEDGLKRFYNFYGQPMQNQNKRAQSISDEIHGADSVSFILPMQMLNCRRALVDEVNRIFGTDISVDFSPLWKLEWEALVLRDTNDNGIPDTKEGDTDGNSDRIGKEDNGTGKDGNGTVETETEPGETETEPEGTEAEPEELLETLTEGVDSPAMALDGSDPTDSTPETENGENGAETDVIRISEISEALGVTVEELRDLLRKDGE